MARAGLHGARRLSLRFAAIGGIDLALTARCPRAVCTVSDFLAVPDFVLLVAMVDSFHRTTHADGKGWTRFAALRPGARTYIHQS
ncbi:hypothetical protein [Mesorhizobium sp. WSM3224]|uniref:hypothetical protein n=1 Tax=Mesorhizobium sp. WSM3224 TaxID=1040986 RepID=UPI0004258043|nr:hypothetical protein [Mesorhizobium sp. WSM3224]